MNDPHYSKRVKISALTLLKMVIHVRSGGTIEIMSLMRGGISDHRRRLYCGYICAMENSVTHTFCAVFFSQLRARSTRNAEKRTNILRDHVPYLEMSFELLLKSKFEYMLGEDKDIVTVMADDEVKSVVRMGVSKIFCSFEMDLSSLLLNSALESGIPDNRILQRVSDLEWMCNVLAKMDLMKNFVSNLASISGKILGVVDDKKLDHVMWGLKVKLIEITGKEVNIQREDIKTLVKSMWNLHGFLHGIFTGVSAEELSN